MEKFYDLSMYNPSNRERNDKLTEIIYILIGELDINNDSEIMKDIWLTPLFDIKYFVITDIEVENLKCILSIKHIDKKGYLHRFFIYDNDIYIAKDNLYTFLCVTENNGIMKEIKECNLSLSDYEIIYGNITDKIIMQTLSIQNGYVNKK